MPRRQFEEFVLPHGRRVQLCSVADEERYGGSLRFFRPSSDDARAWLLTIVRNTWYGRFARQAGAEQLYGFDEMNDDRSDDSLDPETQMIQRQAVDTVRRAIDELPVDFREVVVLRELEGLAYKDIAAVVGIPIGTVMSRLARGRDRLQLILESSATTGGDRDVS